MRSPKFGEQANPPNSYVFPDLIALAVPCDEAGIDSGAKAVAAVTEQASPREDRYWAAPGLRASSTL